MYIDRYLYIFIFGFVQHYFQDTLGTILIIRVIPTPISPETDVYSKIAAIFSLANYNNATPHIYIYYIYIYIYR